MAAMSIDPEGIYDGLGRAWTGRPAVRSARLWQLRRAASIAPCNRSPETILERSVAMLAQRGHMPCYFNQCPAAVGIFGADSYKRTNVDLVRWPDSEKYANLIELKWESGDPHAALSQIVRYGMLYLFCRVHRSRLPLCDRPLMDARHVALNVVAPRKYYRKYSRGFDGEALLARAGARLAAFAGGKTGGALSMTLHACAFPAHFRLPFGNGEEARLHCDRDHLTHEAGAIRDAFANLALLWSGP